MYLLSAGGGARRTYCSNSEWLPIFWSIRRRKQCGPVPSFWSAREWVSLPPRKHEQWTSQVPQIFGIKDDRYSNWQQWEKRDHQQPVTATHPGGHGGRLPKVRPTPQPSPKTAPELHGNGFAVTRPEPGRSQRRCYEMPDGSSVICQLVCWLPYSPYLAEWRASRRRTRFTDVPPLPPQLPLF